MQGIICKIAWKYLETLGTDLAKEFCEEQGEEPPALNIKVLRKAFQEK